MFLSRVSCRDERIKEENARDFSRTFLHRLIAQIQVSRTQNPELHTHTQCKPSKTTEDGKKLYLRRPCPSHHYRPRHRTLSQPGSPYHKLQYRSIRPEQESASNRTASFLLSFHKHAHARAQKETQPVPWSSSPSNKHQRCTSLLAC